MKKGIVVATSLVLMTGLISGAFLYHSTAEAKEQAQQYTRAKEAVNGLYMDTDKTKPNSELSTAQVDRAEELIKKVKDKSKREKLLKLKNAAVTMDAARSHVEAVIENNVLKADATEKKIVSAKDQVAKVENISPSYYQELTRLLDEASKQLKQIDSATQAVNALYKGGKVIVGVSRDDYNKAKTEVNKVKNATIKKKLISQLAQVLKVVKANEEKAKKEAEAKAQAEAKQQKVDTNNTVKSNSNNGSVVKTSQQSSTAQKTKNSRETSSQSGVKSESSNSKSTKHKLSSSSKDDMKPGTTYEGTVTESGSIPGTGNTYLGGTW